MLVVTAASRGSELPFIARPLSMKLFDAASRPKTEKPARPPSADGMSVTPGSVAASAPRSPRAFRSSEDGLRTCSVPDRSSPLPLRPTVGRWPCTRTGPSTVIGFSIRTSAMSTCSSVSRLISKRRGAMPMYCTATQ